MDDSKRQIRRRILGITLRAVIAVVFATALLIYVITAYIVSTSPAILPFGHLTVFGRLSGYYSARGSWDGVETVMALRDNVMDTESAYLLDSSDRIVVDRGTTNTRRVGEVYVPPKGSIVMDIRVAGEKVGSLVYSGSIRSRLGVMFPILLPIGLASLLLAVLAATSAIVLSSRIVTSLAEVIAASRAVAAGRFDTRVQVQGPQDLRALIHSFNQMADALDRNSRERRALLADIAHELRTPLTALRGRLEGIVDGVYPADTEHISQALKAAYLLESLVEDLRLLTLAESRQLHFLQKETDLLTLAQHTVDMFSAEASERGISLRLAETSSRFVAVIDPTRTEQVIGNLVGNALRYTPAGGHILLALEKSGGEITLSVNDNGPGVPAEDLPYIFNRFWRKDKSRARSTGGSGLGLAIAKQFVEAQGGSIVAENVSPAGLRVCVTFAAHDAEQSHPVAGC